MSKLVQQEVKGAIEAAVHFRLPLKSVVEAIYADTQKGIEPFVNATFRDVSAAFIVVMHNFQVANKRDHLTLAAKVLIKLEGKMQ